MSQIVDRGREAYDRARSSVGNMAAAGTSGSTGSTTGGNTGTTGTSNVGTTSTSGGAYGA